MAAVESSLHLPYSSDLASSPRARFTSRGSTRTWDHLWWWGGGSDAELDSGAARKLLLPYNEEVSKKSTRSASTRGRTMWRSHVTVTLIYSRLSLFKSMLPLLRDSCSRTLRRSATSLTGAQTRNYFWRDQQKYDDNVKYSDKTDNK